MASGCSTSEGENAESPEITASSSPAANSPSPAEPATLPKVQNLGCQEVTGLPPGEQIKAATADYVVTTSLKDTRVVVRDTESKRTLLTYDAPARLRLQDVYLRPPSLVVTSYDEVEDAAPEMVVIDLDTGDERVVTGGARKPWTGVSSVGEDYLTYGSHGLDGGYCLTKVDLSTLQTQDVGCVPPRNGIHQVRQSPFGLAYTRFDDTRPASCGSARVAEVSGRDAVDVAGPAPCNVWESVALADGGAAWGEVPKARQIELANYYVRQGAGEPELLADGLTGSLTWCGDSVWFVQSYGRRMLRWSSETGLEEAFRDPKNHEVSALSSPICSGDSLAVLVLSGVAGSRTRQSFTSPSCLGRRAKQQ